MVAAEECKQGIVTKLGSQTARECAARFLTGAAMTGKPIRCDHGELLTQLVQEGVQGGWWSLWPQNQRDSCSAVEAATISQIFRQHLVS